MKCTQNSACNIVSSPQTSLLLLLTNGNFTNLEEISYKDSMAIIVRHEFQSLLLVFSRLLNDSDFQLQEPHSPLSIY